MLYIFGDSFSVGADPQQPSTHKLWSELTAIKLGISKIVGRTQYGVSNEWILNEVLQCSKKFNNHDKVIIQLTSPERQWFFEDMPAVGNFYVADLEKIVSPERAKAVKQFIIHLNSESLNEIRNNLYHLAVERITQILGHVQILVLPGFRDIPSVKGTLNSVSVGEFSSIDAKDKWYDTHKIDPRINHLSAENHKILSDKIVDYFKLGHNIDLTTGFMKGFLK